MKKVVLVSTGGTIASGRDSTTGLVNPNAVSGLDLLNSIPGGLGVDYEVVQPFMMPSPNIGFKELCQLARVIKEQLKDPSIAGIVVTHGTDTLEETAYFLDLVLGKGRPVVITGSQRTFDALSSDALGNLVASIQVACADDSRNRGVLVVFNNRIFAASEVVKVHTNNLDGFAALSFGPLGYVDEDQVVFKRKTDESTPALGFKWASVKDRVYLIKCGLGMGGELIGMALLRGAQGFVLEGFGRGQVPPGVAASALKAVAKGIPVVLTSRCLMGEVKGVYDYEGSGYQLEQKGVILAGGLPAVKARLKLILALSNDLTNSQIKDLFSND